MRKRTRKAIGRLLACPPRRDLLATNVDQASKKRSGCYNNRSRTYLEAISKNHGGDKLRADFVRISERRGKYKARVAVARKLLTLVYYGLRDGQVRCLERQEAA